MRSMFYLMDLRTLCPGNSLSELLGLKCESVSYSVGLNSLGSHWTVAQQALLSMKFSRHRVGCHFLLQVVFPTQGLNPGLLHCRQILCHLSCQESPVSPQQICWMKRNSHLLGQHVQYGWNPNILLGNFQTSHFHSSVTYTTHSPFGATLGCANVPIILAALWMGSPSASSPLLLLPLMQHIAVLRCPIGTHERINPSYPKFKSNLKCLVRVLQRFKRYIGMTKELRILYNNIWKKKKNAVCSLLQMHNINTQCHCLDVTK